MTREAVIVEAVRTPMGKGKVSGCLHEVHPVNLLADTLAALIQRTGIDPGSVDDVLIGCVSQVGEQSGNVGRMAWLAAGFPEHVPSVTIERKCGSGQQALAFAAQGIVAGSYDVIVAGGVESMSRVPMGSNRIGQDFWGSRVTERYAPGLVSQGISSELMTHRWQLTRRDLDEFACLSQSRAAKAMESGAFKREIVPIEVDGSVVERDETVRPSTTLEGLSGLKPSFATPDAMARFPDLKWATTAGNSSQLADGASALLVMERSYAESLGLKPRAILRYAVSVGDDPLLMLAGPIPATRRLLEKSGLSLTDIGAFEVNEAFASVPLAWARELGVDLERVNMRGGAIALGHPLGASGARLMTTLLHILEDNDLQFGIQTMCEAGGMATATLVERC